jgi:hypothetical protein
MIILTISMQTCKTLQKTKKTRFIQIYKFIILFPPASPKNRSGAFSRSPKEACFIRDFRWKLTFCRLEQANR